MSIKLEDLLPAQTTEERKAKPRKLSAKAMAKIKGEAQARLIAQEYVRNGMNMNKAMSTVKGTKLAVNPKLGAMASLGEYADVFMEEVGNIVSKTDITRDEALNIMWAMIHTSLLDFMDERGDILPVADLKKLPRVMQMMISKLSVKSNEEVIKDDDGKPLTDSEGRPYTKLVQRVRIEVPEKLAALQQLATLMKWIGPSVSVTNTVNIGMLISDADSRRDQMEREYENLRIINEGD